MIILAEIVALLYGIKISGNKILVYILKKQNFMDLKKLCLSINPFL